MLLVVSIISFSFAGDGCGRNSYNPVVALPFRDQVPLPPYTPGRAVVLLRWPLGSKSLIRPGCSAPHLPIGGVCIGEMPGRVHMPVGLVGYSPRGCILLPDPLQISLGSHDAQLPVVAS